MSTLPTSPLPVSIDDYLAAERTSATRHEYRAGEIVAMAGGSPRHALLIARMVGELTTALRGGPCAVYAGELLIGIPRRRRLTYADGSVICGPVELDPGDVQGETAINPRVVFEVLSPSTELYDRTEKFAAYRDIAALEDYILIAQDSADVQVYHRNPDASWRFSAYAGLDAEMAIESLGVRVRLARLYEGIEFAPVAEDRP